VSTAAHDPNDHSAAQERHAEPERENEHGSAHSTRADKERGGTQESPIIITTGAGQVADIPNFPPSPTYSPPSSTSPASPAPDPEIDDSSYNDHPVGGKNAQDRGEYLHQNKKSKHNK